MANKQNRQNKSVSKNAPVFRGINVNVRTGRLLLLLIVCVLTLCYVGYFRVYRIKANGSKWETAAITNQMNKVQDKVVSPNRGDIVDRNGENLAVGETVYNIILDVRLLAEEDAKQQKKNADRDIEDQKFPMKDTLDSLNKILGIPMETLNGYMATNPDGSLVRDTHYLVVEKKVDYDKGKQINDLGYNWLYGEQDTKRSYPLGTLAAQVIGFNTTWGLESYYNSEMLGVPGRTFRTYESDGTIVTQRESPIKGNKVVTTLDVNLQKFADQVSKEAYDAYEPEYCATMIMNPNTGEIYAMAQYPSFDPNDPTELTDYDSKEKQEEFDALTEEEQTAEKNRAWKNFMVSETYEPGSIYKPIVVAMALEEGIIKPTDSFVCGGYKRVANEEIPCHNTSGHGTLDVRGILAQSCNVGMMDINAKMSPEIYLKYQHDFGFGEKTGIDLPGEVAAGPPLIYTLDDLHSVEMATSSFGQGFNCTTIQIVDAFAAVINGGKLMKPYIMAQILDNDGNIIEENKPQVVREVISKETSDWVRGAMESVFTEGTGKKAVITGYRFGGKTGTAQQSPRSAQKYNLSFIAYHNVDNPDILVATTMHKPAGYSDAGGAASPVPIIKELFEKIIEYEAIPPDTEEGETTAAANDTSYTVKDYTNSGLKSTVSELIGLGIDFEIIGSGDTVTKQSPAGGTKLEQKPAKILLNISDKGKKTLVPVPNVTGLSTEDAIRMLESSGFEADVSEEKGSDDEDMDIPKAEDVTEVETEEKKEATRKGLTANGDDKEDTEESTDTRDRNDSSEDKKSDTVVYIQMPSAGVKVESGLTVKIRAR